MVVRRGDSAVLEAVWEAVTETTKPLMRKEWSLMANSETLNLLCGQHTKHAWTRDTLEDPYPAKLCAAASHNKSCGWKDGAEHSKLHSKR